MDCLEYRRRLGSDPQARDSDMRAHRETCVSCAGAHARAQRFEHDLLNALTVEVPSNLVERVLLVQATGERRQFVRRRRAVLAIAAAVLCAVGVGGFAWRQIDARSLPALAVAHMPDEIDSFGLKQPIASDAIIAGFALRHVVMKGSLPHDTTYVHDCPVGPYAVVHLVSRVDDQPVAVLYFPNKQAPRKDFARQGWHGREVPLAQGTLVMLTDRGDSHPFNAIEHAWRVAIDGPGDRRVTEL